MKCVRCGYCCIRTEIILPDETAKRTDDPCKFLKWEGEKAICPIHGKSFVYDFHGEKIVVLWEETPCGQHSQIERSPDDVCRIGEFIKSKSVEERRKLLGREPL